MLKEILKYPRTVIIVIVVITIIMGYFASKIKINNSIEAVLDKDDPALKLDHQVKTVFNSREMILISLVNKGGVFNKVSLKKVKEISTSVRKVDLLEKEDKEELLNWSNDFGVKYKEEIDNILKNGLTIEDKGLINNLYYKASNDKDIDKDFLSYLKLLKLKLNPVSDVISLSESDDITSSGWGLKVEAPLKNIPSLDTALSKLKKKVFSNQMFRDGLVSDDGRGTMIFVEMSFYYDDYPHEASVLFERLKDLVKPYNEPEEIQLAGVPMVNVYTGEYMMNDLAKLTPLVLLVVIIILFLSLRMLKGVLLPLSVVIVSLLWTMGLMAIFGTPITLIVTAMPVMLVAIGIADGIHIITEYKLSWIKLGNKDKAIEETMGNLWKPVIFTSLTTMAGFLSLATASIQSIRDFGIYTAVGVLSAMIFSLTFIPAALKLQKAPKSLSGNEKLKNNLLTKLLNASGRFTIKYRKAIIVSVILVGVISVLVITTISVGSTMVGNFHKDSEIYNASETINKSFGGTEVLNIIIDTKRKDGLKDPKVLSKIAALEEYLKELPVVGYTTSLADYVKRINLVMNNNNQNYNRIPFAKDTVYQSETDIINGGEKEVQKSYPVNGEKLISQYLLLYENAGGKNLGKLADYNYRKANMIIQIKDDDTPVLREVKKRAQDFANVQFAGIADVSFAGCSNLCIVADEQIIPSQLKSLIIAFVVVFILLLVIFRSFKQSLISTLPLLITTLLVFFLLAAFGIYLDAATALVASIVLGIGIDYGIHLTSRYNLLIEKGYNNNDAIIESINESGRPVIFNAIAVAIGFLVLIVSNFWPVANIGWLVAVNMILSALFSLLLIPALLSYSVKK